MTKLVGYGCAVIAALGLAALGVRLYGVELLLWWMRPAGRFEQYEPPPAPDYAREAAWAALPTRRDSADAVPPDSGATDRQAEAAADVFYLYPTTYYGSERFNAAVDDARVNHRVDAGVMLYQASSFNAAGRIYAPRYRQLTMGAFADDDAREKGLALAYSDVRRAFDHYLRTWSDGRPLLLVGHSQGAQHLRRLIAERFTDGALRERLVAAYVVGFPVGPDTLPLPACESPDQTGCLVGWITYAEGVEPWQVQGDGAVRTTTLCTNPLTWRTNGEPAAAELHQGGVPLTPGSLHRPDLALTGARCEDGTLRIDPPSAAGYTEMVLGGNYHVHDINLFYMNVRSNARRRVDAWLSAHRGASDGERRS